MPQVSQPSDNPPVPQPQQGAAILLSFKELQALRDKMTRIDGKLDQALTLPVTVADHEKRIVSLETTRAVNEGRGGVVSKAWDFISALILALIAAGVWLPKFH